jgi:hypothetical protein
VIWYRIELFMYLTIIIVNVNFLFLRACCKNNEDLDFSDSKNKLAETDTLESLLIIMNCFTNTMAPGLVSLLVAFTAAVETDLGNPFLFIFMC